MAKRVSATKTTRNKEFNEYDYYFNEDVVRATALSMTANTKRGVQNIRLLGIEDAVIKTGAEIVKDSLSNTTLLEINTGIDKSTADILAFMSVYGNPLSPEYQQIDEMLKKNFDLSLEKIKNKMVINYGDTVLNNDDTPYYIYGAPEQVVLNNRQNYNNCGIESTLNNLAMAGIKKMNENLKDQKSVEKNFLKSVLNRGLAGDQGEIGVLDEPDGGTLPDDYRDIFELYGIRSTAYYITTKADELVYKADRINELAYQISQGYGAVLGVCSDVLWNDTQSEQGGNGSRKVDHAIAITGVVYNTDNIAPVYDDIEGKYNYVAPVGFYIHDSGAWMTRFISLQDFKDATLCDYTYAPEDDLENFKLSSLKEYDAKTHEYVYKTGTGIFVTITDDPIKTDMFDLNATGDKYANIIWGNTGKNVIKGMAGDDSLYGGAGNDTIYGGKGNDIVVGNNAYIFEYDDEEYSSIDDFKEYLATAGKLDDKTDIKLNSIDVDDYGELPSALAVYDAIPTGTNTLYGDAGNDIIIGGEYSDLIYGGDGNDYIYTGGGRNAVYAGAGHDVIVGGYDSDRMFGGAGNDYIFGRDDEDTIDGGDGNDHIYGGAADDRIETGKGTDTIYFEGKKHGNDEITSKSGTTTFKFISDEDGNPGAKVGDMFFSLKKEKDNTKIMNLKIAYSKDAEPTDSVAFDSFYTVKTGKSKALTIVDADEKSFSVSAVKTKKVSLAKSKTNNILFSTYKGAQITTSAKDDVVTMIGTGDESDTTYNKTNIVDKITYTGGNDKYISEERNTYYTAKFDQNTVLSIYDNIDGLKKFDVDAYMAAMTEVTKQGGDPASVDVNDYKTDNAVSTSDSLQINAKKDQFHFFFDVAAEGKKTKSNGLYVVNDTSKYISIADGYDVSGYIYMDSFFSNDENFFGNGRIEYLYYKDDANKVVNYDTFTADLQTIAGQVAGWLSDFNTAHGTDCDSAFAAIQTGQSSPDEWSALVAAYQV